MQWSTGVGTKHVNFYAACQCPPENTDHRRDTPQTVYFIFYKISKESIENNSSLEENSSLNKYHLIIASLTSHEDAEEYIANHTQFDRTQLQIIESKGKYRISAAGFNKYKDAIQYMDSIRNEVPIAKKAWIMCK